ncbi:MAG: hypothetical protein ACFFFB_12960 [Candidatus Heimdallarchaeota archaeon]
MKSTKLVYLLVSILSISTFLTITPYSFGELKTSQSMIFNGLYANYTFDTDASRFQYTRESDEIYNVTWWINGSIPGNWLENTQTRLMLNATGIGLNFGSGVHTPVWVFNNLTLGDTVPIAVDGVGDYLYNVSDEITFNYPGVGSVDIWVLEGEIWTSSIVWYEKSTGLLLNGTFIWFGGDYNLTLTDTNMMSHYQGGKEIPGYNLIIFVPLTIFITLVIVRKWKKNLL